MLPRYKNSNNPFNVLKPAKRKSLPNSAERAYISLNGKTLKAGNIVNWTLLSEKLKTDLSDINCAHYIESDDFEPVYQIYPEDWVQKKVKAFQVDSYRVFHKSLHQHLLIENINDVQLPENFTQVQNILNQLFERNTDKMKLRTLNIAINLAKEYFQYIPGLIAEFKNNPYLQTHLPQLLSNINKMELEVANKKDEYEIRVEKQNEIVKADKKIFDEKCEKVSKLIASICDPATNQEIKEYLRDRQFKSAFEKLKQKFGDHDAAECRIDELGLAITTGIWNPSVITLFEYISQFQMHNQLLESFDRGFSDKMQKLYLLRAIKYANVEFWNKQVEYLKRQEKWKLQKVINYLHKMASEEALENQMILNQNVQQKQDDVLYLSKDEPKKCHRCNKEGHLKKDCPLNKKRPYDDNQSLGKSKNSKPDKSSPPPSQSCCAICGRNNHATEDCWRDPKNKSKRPKFYKDPPLQSDQNKGELSRRVTFNVKN